MAHPLQTMVSLVGWLGCTWESGPLSAVSLVLLGLTRKHTGERMEHRGLELGLDDHSRERVQPTPCKKNTQPSTTVCGPNPNQSFFRLRKSPERSFCGGFHF